MQRVSVVSVFLFSLIAGSVWAQQLEKVSGIVVDSSHARLPRATVRMLANDGSELAHALTDQQGRFELPNRCRAACFLQIELAGFETAKIPIPLDKQEILLALAPVRENIVVTATRTETPTSQVGTTTTTIEGDEITSRQQLMISDLLQSIPGATVIRSGPVGATASLFVRGGESDYTKVLLDGIPLNQPGGAFEFSSLAATDLDHIEVVRGPQSALFGSDAMTGVVQIFSKRGQAEDSRPHLDLNFAAGKYGTLQGGADVNGNFRKLDYDLFWSRLNTDNQGVNDDFRDSTGGANLGLALGERTQFRWIARGDSSRAGTPGQVAFERPDRDAFFRKADGYTGASISNQTSRSWQQRLTYTFARSRQVSRDLIADPPYFPSFEGHTTPFTFFDIPSDFLNDTRRHHVDYQSDLTFGSGDRRRGQHILTFAFDFDRELGFIGDRLSGAVPIQAQRDNFGGTFQHQLALGRLFLSNGVRVEDNGSFGRTVIPRSSAALLLRQGGAGLGTTKLKFNFGLGVKEPSFTESFSPEPSFLGNPNLQPERTRSFDFGLEQRLWNDHAKVELNWFDNRFRDLIEFQTISFEPFLGTFFNLDAAKANGAEIIVEAAPVSGVRLRAQYTLLNGQITRSSTPADPIFGEGQALLRRPRHSGALGIFWTWRRLTLSSNAVYVGRRVDSDFAGLEPPISSDGPFTKWDLAWTLRLARGLSYIGTAENLLDRRYMEALGFPALRIAYRTGLNFVF